MTARASAESRSPWSVNSGSKISPRTLPTVNWKTMIASAKAANGSVSSGKERATSTATTTLLRLEAA